eukprot:c46626_g1_i1.p1 GENE.c46626_g1_i1~~c46626_g1_i1.p1  ORF type:complete len:397 (+),score=41.06 c46626_g1_i1:53-1243(+)
MDAKRFARLRASLNESNFRQPLGLESAALVEAVLGELVASTYRGQRLEEDNAALEAELILVKNQLVPTRKENSRLLRENNGLHLELVSKAEQYEQTRTQTAQEHQQLVSRAEELSLVCQHLGARARELESRLAAARRHIEQLAPADVEFRALAAAGAEYHGPVRSFTVTALLPQPPQSAEAMAPLPEAADRERVDLVAAATARLEHVQAQLDMCMQTNVELEGDLRARDALVTQLRQELHRLHEQARSAVLTVERPLDPVVALLQLSQANEYVVDQLSAQVHLLRSQLGEQDARLRSDAATSVQQRVSHQRGAQQRGRSAVDGKTRAAPSRLARLEHENVLLRSSCDEILRCNQVLCEELAIVESAFKVKSLTTSPMTAADARQMLVASGHVREPL